MEDLEKIKRRMRFASKLPTYSPLGMLVRFAIVSVIAIIALELIVYTVRDIPKLKATGGPFLSDYLLVIFTFNLLSELLIILDNVLERFLPIPEKIKERFLTQTCLSIILIIGVFNFTLAIAPKHEFEELTRTPYYMGVAIGLVFVMFLSTALLLMRLMEKWVYTRQSLDEMKQQKLKMDYTALQDQLNPHFLFNNLSVLKSLIIYDKDSAVHFTENFTDVYRYVLQSKDKMLVEFKEEQAFISSFIALHKERLGDGLKVKFSIDRNSLTAEIAPLTLQLLVENAIKHNVTSKDRPLKIEIITEDDYLYVKNVLQLKEASYSTHTGLKNLIKRYHMLTEKEIEILEEENLFIVKVPLL